MPLLTLTGRVATYRASIDDLDAAIVHLLAERFKLTRAVGELKAASGWPAAALRADERMWSACELLPSALS